MTVIDLASAERPRVLHLPRFSTSAGDEAIDLARQAGLLLDPWQQFVLRNSLGEREDGRWAAFEVGLIVARQQGKGAVLEARELAGLVLFGEQLVMHTAHELKTSMQHFKRLMTLFEATDDLRKRVKRVSRSNGKEGLTMVSGAELQCLARSKGSGRGFSGDLVVMDEAYALTEEQMDATIPTMLARDNSQVWYTSSPPLDAVSGQILMGLRERAEAGGGSRLAWFDYGLAGSLDKVDEMDLDDRDAWFRALPSMRSGRVREENVQVMRDSLTDKGFAREILGIWPPGLGRSFRIVSEDDWADAYDAESEIDGPR
jgi:phage terminase large subunit-like protein